MNNKSSTKLASLGFRSRSLILGLGALALGLGLWAISKRAAGDAEGPTFVVKRGPLNISVIEGGSIQALESQEIKCEVRVGYQGTKILKIVEEGYLVTPDDVKAGKVLVELDSSEIQKQLVQQEIQFQSAAASLTDAQQAHDIQLNQNISDVKAAEQKARFARLDFDKFLGAQVAQVVVDTLAKQQPLAEVRPAIPVSTSPSASSLFTGDASPTASGGPLPSPSPELPAGEPQIIVRALNVVSKESQPVPPDTAPISVPAKSEPVAKAAPEQVPVIDFGQYAKIELLGDGEAKQKLRKFQDDYQVAQKELEQARATLEGTRRLFGSGFVTRTDLQRDEIAYENNRLKVQTAETARDLFIRYEFIKTAEESLSKHSEALRELDRARRAAVSKLAQTEAKLKSAEAQYNVQLRQRKDLNAQMEKCIIKANKTGLVVYGGGGDQYGYYGGEERIREGATVRERQSIITIPDMTRMSVRVKVHESYIKKVKKGQKVTVTADAFPDKVLTGEVTKVGVLPDSQDRWMNPDLKVYLTTITIDGTHDWIKPGMTAKAEIAVDRLDAVLQVPMQAVSPRNGKQVCYIAGGSSTDLREIEIGDFNDEFIEIRKGLQEGERILLRPPEGTGPSSEAPVKTEVPPPVPVPPAKQSASVAPSKGTRL